MLVGVRLVHKCGCQQEKGMLIDQRRWRGMRGSRLHPKALDGPSSIAVTCTENNLWTVALPVVPRAAAHA